MPVVIRKEDQRDGGGYAVPSTIPIKIYLIEDSNNYMCYKVTSPTYTRVKIGSNNSAVNFRADCGDYRIKLKMISLAIDECIKNGKLKNIKYVEIYDGQTDGGPLLREYSILNTSPLKYKRRYRYGKMIGKLKLIETLRPGVF